MPVPNVPGPVSAYLAGLAVLRFEEDERCKDLSSSALLVFVAMASYAGRGEPAYYGSQETLAGRTRLTSRAVRQALKRLELAGAIARCGRSGKTVRWTLPLLSERGSYKRDPEDGQDNPERGSYKNPERGSYKNPERGSYKAKETNEPKEEQTSYTAVASWPGDC